MRAWLLAFGALGLMTSGAVAQEVGVTSAINQSAIGLAPGQAPKTMYLGDKIIHNQKITTNATGLLQILLADGTSFTVGPNSSMTIDSFVYDPDAGTAKVVADLGTGVFRFIGGKSSKSPDGVTLNTPVGTVGIQGGITNLDFSGATDAHIDMVYGVGVKLTNGTTVIGDLYHSGYSIVIGNDGKVDVTKTPPEWSAAFQTAMTGHGSGGSVSGTKVAGLSSTNKTTNPQGSGDQGTGNDDSQEAPGIVSTWSQIGENADLMTVGATYDGTYSATVTGEDRVVGDLPDTISAGKFALDFTFASRTGTAYFAEVGDEDDEIRTDPALAIPVTGTTGQGPATFGFNGSLDNPDLQKYPYFSSESGSATLNGFFLNANGQIAYGTAGTFTGTVNNGEDGSYTMTGAFAGHR